MREHKLWTRLTLEAMVIVLSILLGLGTDAWWSSRKDRERAVAALVSLQAGFEEHLRLIDAELQRIAPFEERVAFFLDAAAHLDAPPAPYGEILEAIYRPGVETLNTDELMALLDAESLRDLDAPGLWSASARWRGWWRVILDRHDSLYEMEDEALRALSRREAIRVIVSSEGPWEEVDEAALRDARTDEDLLTLAATKSNHQRTLRFLYGRLRRRGEAVLVQISLELAR